jgi:diguanylate cyclase (GGDEF)-like protein
MKLTLLAALLFITLTPHMNDADILPRTQAAAGFLSPALAMGPKSHFVPYAQFRPEGKIASVWLRFNVTLAKTAAARWAVALPADVPVATFYVPNSDGRYEERTVGSRVPFAQLQQPFPRVGTTIDASQVGSRPIYVHVQYYPDAGLEVHLRPENREIELMFFGHLMLGLFLGVMLAVGTANLYMALVMRDSGARYFTIYILAIAAHAAATSGMGAEYVWPRTAIDPFWTVGITGAASFVAFLMFVRTFLATNSALPVLDKLLMAAFGVDAVLSLPVVSSPVVDDVSMVTLCSAMLLTIAAAAIRARQGNFPARIFLAGFLPVAIGFFIGEIAFGWMIQIIVLSLGVIERMRRLAAEKRITELRNQELRALAYFDPLTGVFNRIAFDDRLLVAMAESRQAGQSLALFYIDLDGFKGVNDSFGHQTGDRVLQIVAERLQNAVRDEVARLGGDEFAVIARTPPEDVANIRDNIASILDEPVMVSGQAVDLGLSVGAAVFPRDGTTADELLSAADRDMYRMKRAPVRQTVS